MTLPLQIRKSLGNIAEQRKIPAMRKVIPASQAEEVREHGWTEEQPEGGKPKRSSKKKHAPDELLTMTKPKPYGLEIADRIWCLLYTMGFSQMSDGEIVQLSSEQLHIRQKVDMNIVSLDDEVALAIFLQTSSERRAADACLLEDLRLYSKIRPDFTKEISRYKSSPQSDNHKQAFLLFHCGITLSSEEKEAAKKNNVVLFTEHDLAYFEDLADRMGKAARYQFLAEVFADQEIGGLAMEVPAIKLRAGSRYTYYVFAIRPDRLLKIAFIAHHKPGREADLTTTYQRLANKERLEAMRQYLKEEGVYPTNIVVSLTRSPDFLRNPNQSKAESIHTYHSEVGTLTLAGYYKSAWVIDGQHRLFSYAGGDGENRAERSSIVVVAFENLTIGEQMRFFSDINSKQTRINDQHLALLQSNFSQNADKLADQLPHLLSLTLFQLEAQPDSLFYQRICLPDQASDNNHPIRYSLFFDQLVDPVFTKIEYGVFYVKNDANATVERATVLLNAWFTMATAQVRSWWDAGASPRKGGLATEEGVIFFMSILTAVLDSLIRQKNGLASLSTQELVQLLQPFADKVSRRLASFKDQDKADFRKDLKAKSGLPRTKQIDAMLELLYNEDEISS